MGPPLGAAMEFLSQVLSQRGPKAVPYTESYKYNIRQHVSDLLKMFPALTVTVSEFHNTDGRILHLVRAHGTIPIHYQAAKYNIPVVIWLPERYPVQGPLAYVTPTPNMIIRPGHPFVDASGQVRTPYLANWLHPSSDLSTMTQEMAMIFGSDPPLYSTPAERTPPPSYSGYPTYPATQQQQPQQQQQQQQQNSPGSHQHQQQQRHQQQQAPSQHPDAMLAGGQALWGGAYAAAMQQQAPGPAQQQQQQLAGSSTWPPSGYSAGGGTPSPQPPQPQPLPPGPKPPSKEQQELEALFRGPAIKALQGRVQAGLEAYSRHAVAELDALLEAQRTLSKRDVELGAMVAAIQRERAGTEGLVTELGAKCVALEEWLEAHEWKAAALTQAGGSGAVDVNAVVVPADGLSRAALGAQAEDLAIEDVLVVLDKALLQGKMSPDVYLKQVRLLCRQQFFARAKGLKVAQLQRQQPQARQLGGDGACTMTHGDAWSHGQSVAVPAGSRH